MELVIFCPECKIQFIKRERVVPYNENYYHEECYNRNILNIKSTHGGRRIGAGRPIGSLGKATKEQKIIEDEFKNRILNNIHELLNAQMNIAKGSSYLFKVVETGEGKEVKREHVLVTSSKEISSFLDEMQGADVGVVDDTYYYITTKQPDNKALDSLIDRVLGKSRQTTDITSGGKSFIPNTEEEKKIDDALDKLNIGQLEQA